MPNHEGIKKTSVSKGNVRKNTVKVYHYEPIKCDLAEFAESNATSPPVVEDKLKPKKAPEPPKKDTGKDKKDDKDKKGKQEAGSTP